jgi:hypothetical protein
LWLLLSLSLLLPKSDKVGFSVALERDKRGTESFGLEKTGE